MVKPLLMRSTNLKNYVMRKNKNQKVEILKLMGIDAFIAVKNNYNKCVNAFYFYKMLQRRLEYKQPKELAPFLKAELHYHFKEYAQYQN